MGFTDKEIELLVQHMKALYDDQMKARTAVLAAITYSTDAQTQEIKIRFQAGAPNAELQSWCDPVEKTFVIEKAPPKYSMGGLTYNGCPICDFYSGNENSVMSNQFKNTRKHVKHFPPRPATPRTLLRPGSRSARGRRRPRSHLPLTHRARLSGQISSRRWRIAHAGRFQK